MPQDAISFIEDGLAMLAEAIDDHGPLREIQLATLSHDHHPSLRTLVLRAFERLPAACAEMHSDARAAKVDEIARDGRVALLAWSPSQHLQIRFRGAARLHRDDEIARARWDALSVNGRKAYGLLARPGTPIADPSDKSHLSPEEQFRQFVVIRVSLIDVDMLQLGRDGAQTRARGIFAPEGLSAEWIGA